MAPALFTDDYIKRMCPENQPIPLRRMSVLDPTTEPAYLARGFTGIRYVPQPTRPPRNVETLARTMASMRMGTSGYGDDDVRQQRAVIQGFVQGAAPPPAAPAPAPAPPAPAPPAAPPAPAPAPAPNGPAAMDDDGDDGLGGGGEIEELPGFGYPVPPFAYDVGGMPHALGRDVNRGNIVINMDNRHRDVDPYGEVARHTPPRAASHRGPGFNTVTPPSTLPQASLSRVQPRYAATAREDLDLRPERARRDAQRAQQARLDARLRRIQDNPNEYNN